MHQRQLVRLLFRPSLFSGLCTGLVAAVLIGLIVWPYFVGNTFLQQLSEGSSYALARAFQETPDISNFTTAFSASPLAYNLIILIVGVLVGVGVYVLLQISSKSIAGTYDVWRTVHDKGKVSSATREASRQFTVRVLSALIGLGFGVVFLNLVLPYAVFITRVGAEHITDWGVVQVLFGYGLIVVSMHLLVVFLRLVLLRPRVFGGQLDILEAIYEADRK